MAYEDDDSREFIGTTNAIKAAPRAVKARVAEKPVPVFRPEPVKAGTPEHASGSASHAKHAIARPAKEYAAAQQETEAARIDYRAASFAFKEAEKAEGAAVADWIKLNPPPSADEVYRAHVQRSQDERAANVAAGKPPGGERAAPH